MAGFFGRFVAVSLTKTAAPRSASNDRSERWRALLVRTTVAREGESIRLTMPAERARHVMTLVQEEHAANPASSFVVALEYGNCTVTVIDDLLPSEPLIEQSSNTET